MAPASRKLRESLERQLGPDEADELLNLIPPDWTQLATKHDVAVLGSELRSEMANLRTELKTDMAMLRSEFGELKGEFGELKGEFGELKGQFGELKGQFGELTGDFGRLEGQTLAGFASLRSELHNQLRMQTYLLLGAATGLAGLVVALR